MSFRRLLPIGLSALLGALASTFAAVPALAQAEEDPEPEVSIEAAQPSPWDRFLAVSGTVGIDTPFGIGGVALEVTPFRYLTIYAGGGVGRDGVRFAGGLHPQLPMGDAALGLMLGVTGGPLDWDTRGRAQSEGEVVVHRYWEMALFWHTALTFEYRWDSGLFGRLAFGVEALLEPGSATVCTIGGTTCGADVSPYYYSGDGFKPVRAWAGLTVGYAFEL